MIIARTPYRISFFGGGTDYPDWYLKNGGRVISTTINRYSYITCRYLPNFFEYKYRIRYYKREEVSEASDIQHPVVKACILQSNITQGLDLVHHGDLPAMGGLGSSSSFTVGMIHALSALRGQRISKAGLARQAIEMEQKFLRENVGSQDQVAAAYGGLNSIVFDKNGSIDVESINLHKEKYLEIQNKCCLFFTGITRRADSIAAEQIQNIKSGMRLDETRDLADRCLEIINKSGSFAEDFGRLLDYQWRLKKGHAKKISNPLIDEIYSTGIKNGALGGKLLGAGGGGFILFIVNDKEGFIKKMDKLVHVPIEFESEGSKIIYMNNTDS